MTFALGILVTTVILAITLATHQPIALLTFLAYPTLFAATYVFYVGRRLTGWSRNRTRPPTGWSRRWTRHPQIAQDGMHVDFQIRVKGNPFLMPLPLNSQIECSVWSPAGHETRVTNVNALGARGWVYFSYPDPPYLAPLPFGSYWVTWQWRDPAGSPRWHTYDAHRVVIPATAAALPAP
jgi:hypothetical protein